MRKIFGLLALLLICAGQAAAEDDWRTAAAWRAALNAADQAGGGDDRRTTAGLFMAMFSAGNAVDRRFEPLLAALDGYDGAADAERAAAFAGHAYILAVTGDAEASAALMKAATKGLGASDRRRLEALAEAATEAARTRANASETEMEYWRPEPKTPGRYTPVEVPVTMDRAHLKPLAIPARDAFRPDGPPAIDSDVYARDWDEVRRLGGRVSERTEAQSKEAHFWFVPELANPLNEIVARRDLDLLDEARINMLFEMIVSDAGLASGDAKNHFLFWRPIAAIRRADLDGRPETTPDPSWTPYLRTPNHPEYVCGHCIWGASAARALERLLPLEEGETFRVTDEKEAGAPLPILGYFGYRADLIDGMSVELASYDEMRRRISDARIYAGAHFRTSNDHGEETGRAVADYVIENIAAPR